MSKPKLVLVSDGLHSDGIELLRAYPELFELEVYPHCSRETLLEKVRHAQICVIKTASQMDREVFEHAEQLEIIGRAGVGTDNIDLDAASEKGVLVFNTPQENANATAEHCLALLLCLVRRIPAAHQSLLDSKWDRKHFMGVEISGKTITLIGFGNIGRAFAPKLKSLGMRVLAFDPYIDAEIFENFGVERVDLGQALASSDIVSLHIPLNTRNRHFFGANQFSQMKAGSFFMNCARGGVSDEAALLQALDSGHIAGAALDVFESEPPPFPHPLIQHPRVICTPHLGGQTEEAQRAVARGIAERLIDYYTKAEIRNLVNPEVLERKIL